MHIFTNIILSILGLGRISGWFIMPDIRLSRRISGNLSDIKRWPDIQLDTGYPALEISRISGIRHLKSAGYPAFEICRISGIRAKKVSGPTLVNIYRCMIMLIIHINKFQSISKEKLNVMLFLLCKVWLEHFYKIMVQYGNYIFSYLEILW